MFVCIRRSQGTCFFFRSLMDAMSLLRTSATAYRLLIVLLSHFLSPPPALDHSLNFYWKGGKIYKSGCRMNPSRSSASSKMMLSLSAFLSRILYTQFKRPLSRLERM